MRAVRPSHAVVRVGLSEILDLLPLLHECDEGALGEEVTDQACNYLALLGVQTDDEHASASLPDADEFIAVLLRAADVLRQEGEHLLLGELQDTGDHCASMASALGIASELGLGPWVWIGSGLDGLPVLMVGGRRG